MVEYQGEKFRSFLKRRGISAEKAAAMMGLSSRQSIYKYYDTRNLSREVVNNILTTFEVSENDIWPDDSLQEPKAEFKRTLRLEAEPKGLHDPEGYGDTGQKIYELPDGTKIMNVKVIQHKAYAGFLRGFQDPEYFEELPTIRVIVNEEHKGEYLAFIAKGDSMTPSKMDDLPFAVLDGWTVIGRNLSKHLWKYHLHTSRTHKWIIVHKDEGILIKQIIKHDVDNGVITIHSLNDKYPDQELKLDDIDLIYNVVKTEINDR